MTNIRIVGLLATVLLGSIAPLTQAATTYGPPTPPAFPLTFYQASLLLSGTTDVAAGAGTAASAGITSITMSNQSSSAVQVDVFQATTSGPGCSGTVTSIGGSPDIYFIVPALGTLHLDFPTPLKVPHLSGQSCLGFEAVNLPAGNTIAVLLNGYFD